MIEQFRKGLYKSSDEYPGAVRQRLESHATQNHFRRSSFDVVLAYNLTDWASGYMEVVLLWHSFILFRTSLRNSVFSKNGLC